MRTSAASGTRRRPMARNTASNATWIHRPVQHTGVAGCRCLTVLRAAPRSGAAGRAGAGLDALGGRDRVRAASACALLGDARQLAFRVALLDGFALVVELLAARQANLDLGAIAAEVE